jgi:hypothetical protein
MSVEYFNNEGKFLVRPKVCEYLKKKEQAIFKRLPKSFQLMIQVMLMAKCNKNIPGFHNFPRNVITLLWQYDAIMSVDNLRRIMVACEANDIVNDVRSCLFVLFFVFFFF